jgi:small-conductance mechanosensitive channel
VSLSLGEVLGFAGTLLAAALLSTALRALLERGVFPRLQLRRGIAQAISTTLHYAALLLGFILALGAAGVDLSRFTLLAGAFGVGLGFGLQNVVSNFVSGLILLYERPIQVGDSVEVAGVQGEVRRIGIRSSTLRTGEGAEVIVPNARLIENQVINWTLSDQERRIELRVGVAYGSEPRRVLEILLDVARAHPEVMVEPPPQALFLGFGESSLDFQLLAWTSNFAGSARIKSELGLGMHDALGSSGIEIPFPQRDLHLRSVPGTSKPA